MTGLVAAAVVAFLAPHRIAVVALGSDPTATGALQRDLESALAHDALVVPAATFAPGLPLVPAAAESPEIAALSKKIAEAKNAYFDADFTGASKALDSIASEVDSREQLPTKDRVLFDLTKLAVLQSNNGSKSDIDAFARKAVAIGGPAPADLALFPSSVGQLYHATFAGMTPVPVSITAPPHATVKVDDVPRPAKFTLLQGRHVLSVGGPGFATVTRFLEVGPSRIEESVPLALALPPQLASMNPGASIAGSEHLLDRIAEQAGSEGLVLARAEAGSVRTAVWWRGATSATSVEASSIAASVPGLSRILAKGPPRPVAMRGTDPNPPGGGHGRGAPTTLERGALAFDLDGGVVVEQLGRSVTGTPASAGASKIYSVALTGAGPRLRAAATWNHVVGRASVSFIDYLTSIDAQNLPPPNDTKTVAGGTFLRAGLAAGYRLGGARENEPSLGLLVGAEQTTYSIGDAGGNHVFSGWQALWLTAGLEGELPVGSTRFHGSLGIASPMGWAESKKGTSGELKSAALAPRAAIGASFNVRESADLGAELFFEQRNVTFKGDVLAAYQPAYSDAKLAETEMGLTITMRFGR